MGREELIDQLEKYFNEEEAKGLANFIKDGADFAMGDALAGANLKNNVETYKKIEQMFQDSGLDVSFDAKIPQEVVGFVNNPDTGDEELDEAIKSMI